MPQNENTCKLKYPPLEPTLSQLAYMQIARPLRHSCNNVNNSKNKIKMERKNSLEEDQVQEQWVVWGMCHGRVAHVAPQCLAIAQGHSLKA